MLRSLASHVKTCVPLVQIPLYVSAPHDIVPYLKVRVSVGDISKCVFIVIFIPLSNLPEM